jgi:hypothetical protein
VLASPLRFRLPRAIFMIAHIFSVARQVEEGKEEKSFREGAMRESFDVSSVCSCESSSGGSLMIAVGILNNSVQFTRIRII